jgi:hypothetical protein
MCPERARGSSSSQSWGREDYHFCPCALTPGSVLFLPKSICLSSIRNFSKPQWFHPAYLTGSLKCSFLIMNHCKVRDTKVIIPHPPFSYPGPLYCHHPMHIPNSMGENGPRLVKVVALCHMAGLSHSCGLCSSPCHLGAMHQGKKVLLWFADWLGACSPP